MSVPPAYEPNRRYLIGGDTLNALIERAATAQLMPGEGYELEIQPGKGTRLWLDNTREVRQLQVAGGDDEVLAFYGEAYGLGFGGEIDGMTIGEWSAYASTSGLDLYLKIEFEPESEAVQVATEEGNETTVYVLAGGGSNGAVSIHTQTAGAAKPSDTDPEVDPTTGTATTDGLYYIRFGTVSVAAGAQNAFYGPVGIGFCPPSSIKVWSMSQPSV